MFIKKTHALSLTFLLLVLPKMVMSGDIWFPGLADGFWYSLYLLFFSPASLVFLLPIVIGLLYPKNFIAVWHLVILFLTILISVLIVKVGFPYIESNLIEINEDAVIVVLLLSFMYSSFLSFVAYISSTAGMLFSERVYNMQKVFNRINYKTSILFIYTVYSVSVIPFVYFSERNVSYLYHTEYGSVWIWVMASLTILLVLALCLYKTAVYMPVRDFITKKSDLIHFAVIIIVLVVSMILGYILYPPEFVGAYLPFF